MDRTFGVGVVLTALALVGYGLGIVAPYPGRSISIAGVMVGITLLAIGNAEVTDE